MSASSPTHAGSRKSARVSARCLSPGVATFANYPTAGARRMQRTIRAFPKEGYEIVERLRTGIETMAIDLGTGEAIRLTASFGITLLDPDVPVEESIARADQALYQAEDAGRNQTRQWEPILTPVS